MIRAPRRRVVAVLPGPEERAAQVAAALRAVGDRPLAADGPSTTGWIALPPVVVIEVERRPKRQR
jgi:hypothetical protein